MNFRTVVDIPKNLLSISHANKILLLGSCFAEHMGHMLVDAKFQCDVNPFGIQYNPLSIAEALKQIMEAKTYTTSDLFFDGECYRSYMHHGVFAHSEQEIMLQDINARIRKAHDLLPQTDYVLLTFGTAWIYTLKDSGQIVSNCHKVPSSHFNRSRLSVDAIVERYTELLQKVWQLNPRCKFIFTVSPIRHMKDGAHGNQLSKSTLLLAIDRLCELFPEQTVYFPSYELVLDELRDYRFYADDMIHPSPVAVSYIWKRFADAFFDSETQTMIKACERIKKDLLHRPINRTSEAYRSFLEQLILKIERITGKYPNLDFEKEKKQCHTLLKSLPNI